MGWVFAVNGFCFATWAARLPAIRDELHLSPGRLGLVILALSAGAITALPVSGALVHRFGPRRTVVGCALLEACALSGVGLATAVPALVVSLFAQGVASGTWDVAMNVAAADVERRLRRPIMSRFHAGFSLGTVAGAAVGAAAAALGLPVRVHLLGAAVVGVVIALRAGWLILPVRPEPSVGPTPAEGSGALAAWQEPRTLGIGALVLGMAFCEGSANDWLAVAVVDGYSADHAVGAAGFGVFVAAMTAGRVLGPAAIARHGRVRVLRVGAGLVLAGVLLLVAGPALHRLPVPVGTPAALAVAALGALCWGAGASLGFPIGMSAAADDAGRAAARIGVVATIGYTAFIAGPPLLGLLGSHVGTLRAQLGVLVAVVLSMATAATTRPLSARPVPRVG